MIKTFKGRISMNEEARLRLSTNKGLIGYKIKDFQIMSSTPGTGNVEMIGQLFTQSQLPDSVSTTVNFDNPLILGVALYHDGAANDTTHFMSTTIFDAKTINQDIFVNITDATGSSIKGNYYIELEQVALDLNQATVATLKNMRGRE